MERTRLQHDSAWALATSDVERVVEEVGQLPEEKRQALFDKFYQDARRMLLFYEIQIDRQQQRLRGAGKN